MIIVDLRKLMHVVFITLFFAGCGGGGGSSPSTSSTTGNTVSNSGSTGTSGPVGGTVAVGTPIINAAINVTCSAGAAIPSTTTNGFGNWQVTLSGQTLPCAVEASGGLINGITNTVTYHSIAVSTGTVNVTPLTELVVSNLIGNSSTSSWFSGLKSNPNSLTTYTNALVNAAINNVATQMSGLAPLKSINPITGTFIPVTGNIMDDMLSAINAATGNSAANFSNLLAAISSDTPISQSVNTALSTSFANTASGLNPINVYGGPNPINIAVGASVSIGSNLLAPSNISPSIYVEDASGNPISGADAKLIWSSSDTSIVQLSSSTSTANLPVISTSKTGSARISITYPASSGNITTTWPVNVIVPKLYLPSTTIPLGGSVPAFFTDGANNQVAMPPGVTITSGNTTFASVTSNGINTLISGNQTGHTTLSVSGTWGAAGAQTVNQVQICVDNASGTYCNASSAAPSSGGATAPPAVSSGNVSMTLSTSTCDLYLGDTSSFGPGNYYTVRINASGTITESPYVLTAQATSAYFNSGAGYSFPTVTLYADLSGNDPNPENTNSLVAPGPTSAWLDGGWGFTDPVEPQNDPQNGSSAPTTNTTGNPITGAWNKVYVPGEDSWDQILLPTTNPPLVYLYAVWQAMDPVTLTISSQSINLGPVKCTVH